MSMYVCVIYRNSVLKQILRKGLCISVSMLDYKDYHGIFIPHVITFCMFQCHIYKTNIKNISDVKRNMLTMER